MARKIVKTVIISIAGLIGVIVILVIALQALGIGHLNLYTPVTRKKAYALPQEASFPSPLHAVGNQLLNENGEIVRLRGVMIPDPARLRQDGRFSQELIGEVRATGANVIRVPVHPENWEHDKDYLWRYLDPLVTWAGEAGMYVIIDLHFIGNITSGAGNQMPDLNMPAAEFADQFWSVVAPYFSAAPNVLFELYNEPADITAEDWINASTHLVELIRSYGITQPLIVGGVDYSRDLSWVMESPLKDDNLAYASHIYPSHAQSSWEHWFVEAAEKYPVLITEWGYLDGTKVEGPGYLAGSRENYGEPLLAALDELGAGWIACWYDDEWLPPMFAKERETMTDYGQWVIDELKH